MKVCEFVFIIIASILNVLDQVNFFKIIKNQVLKYVCWNSEQDKKAIN